MVLLLFASVFLGIMDRTCCGTMLFKKLNLLVQNEHGDLVHIKSLALTAKLQGTDGMDL